VDLGERSGDRPLKGQVRRMVGKGIEQTRVSFYEWRVGSPCFQRSCLIREGLTGGIRSVADEGEALERGDVVGLSASKDVEAVEVTLGGLTKRISLGN